MWGALFLKTILSHPLWPDFLRTHACRWGKLLLYVLACPCVYILLLYKSSKSLRTWCSTCIKTTEKYRFSQNSKILYYNTVEYRTHLYGRILAYYAGTVPSQLSYAQKSFNFTNECQKNIPARVLHSSSLYSYACKAVDFIMKIQKSDFQWVRTLM